MVSVSGDVSGALLSVTVESPFATEVATAWKSNEESSVNGGLGARFRLL